MKFGNFEIGNLKIGKFETVINDVSGISCLSNFVKMGTGNNGIGWMKSQNHGYEFQIDQKARDGKLVNPTNFSIFK